MTGEPSTGRWRLAMLLLAAVYLGIHLTRGWFPHDEGALGQTAERVLLGEVPHRDFDEPYTGLLTYLHAAAFAAGGVRLPVLRLPLFVGALLWLAAVFAIARRSAGPMAAAAVGLLCLLWSVPNYPASMPSWYNLFFATWGALALLRWLEDRRPGWLFLAGLAGGVSFLIKLSGLFAVAGGLLFLVYATRDPSPSGADRPAGRAGAAGLVTAGLALFIVLLWRSIAPYYEARPILHFVVPGGALALALIWREWSAAPAAGWGRVAELMRAGLPFLAGVAAPIAVFFAGYAMAGGLGALLQGVFVAPFRRLAYANMRPPAPYWILATVPVLVLLRPRPDPDAGKWRRMGLLVGVLLGLVLMLAYTDSFPHRMVWQSLRSFPPVLALAGAAVVAWPRLTAGWAPGARERFVLLILIAALASLVQFPFSSPTYFLYAAPLFLLALVALVSAVGRTPPPLVSATMAFYAVFALLLVTPGAVVGLAFRYETPHQTERLQLPRAGLRVLPADAALYRALIPRFQEAAHGGDVWAGPDAPEVYFLSGSRNRTRAIFDFLGGEDGANAELMREVNRPEVTAVAINLTPSFSRPLPPGVLEELRRRFPLGQTIGRFEIRWRE